MTGLLAGKRVLVVEDEYFIASDLKRELTREGAEIVGPVGNLEAGLSLAEDDIDAAVLDVNLEESLSYPIADRLGSRAIPYLFLTGYDGWAVPGAYRETPRLEKPFSPASIVRMVTDLVSIGPTVAR